MPEPQYMSRSKLAELRAELAELRTVRKPAVARQINLARTGGVEGNAEQELARQELAFVEGKIRALENLIGNAIVAASAGEGAASAGEGAASAGEGAVSPGEGAVSPGEGAVSPGVVGLWRIVTVERENGQQVQYQITGSAEADPGRGKISHVSPIGKSLMGKRAGDTAEVRIPMGKKAGDTAEARIPSGAAKLKIVSVR